MNKIRVSLRLDADLVKRIDSKKTKTRTRNDVISDLMLSALEVQSVHSSIQDSEQVKQSGSQANLMAKGAKASIMLLKMAELAMKQHSDHASEILTKTQAHYSKEIKTLASELETQLEEA